MKGRKIITVFIFMILFILVGLNQSEAQTNDKNFIEGSSYSNILEVITLNEEQYTVISTNIGLNIIQDNEIKHMLPLNANGLYIDVLKDSNNNGYEEILVITESTTKDNILVFDSKNYEKLWSASITMPAYDSIKGYYEQVVIVEDYLLRDDLVVLVAGYHVKAYDLTGRLLWSYEGENNLWTVEAIGDINNDKVEDYVVSQQWAKIIAISGKTGNPLYRKTLGSSIVTRHEEFPPNIWDFTFDTDTNILYVVGEDGYLYRIQPKTGTLIDKSYAEILQTSDVVAKKEIYKSEKAYLDRYFDNGTGKNDSLFFKMISVELMSDVNGDGVNDLLYYQNVDKNNSSRYVYESNEAKIIALSGKDLSVLYEVEVEQYGYGKTWFRGTYQNQDVFFISSANTTTFDIVAVHDGSYFAKKFKIDQPLNESIDKILPNDTGGFYLTGQVGISTVDLDDTLEDYLIGTISSVVLKIAHSNYLEYNNEIFYLKGAYPVSNSSYLKDRYFYLETDAWNYQLPYEDYYYSNGFSIMDYKEDINNDETADFILLVNPKVQYVNEEEPESGLVEKRPFVITLDGATGAELNRSTVMIPQDDLTLTITYNEFIINNEYNKYLSVNINRYGSFKDMNEDGVKEYYFINGKGEIYFYDLKNNTILDYYVNNDLLPLTNTTHFTTIDFNNVYYMNDISGNGNRDFIFLQGNKVSLIEVKEEFVIDETDIVQLDTLDGLGLSGEYTKINLIGDIDGDGVLDLSVVSPNNDKSILNIISSKNGKIITSLPCNPGDQFKLAPYDINRDGYKEIVNVSLDMYQRVNLYVLDGQTNKMIFMSNMFRRLDKYQNNLNNEDFYTIFKEENRYYIALYTKKNYTDISDIYIYDLKKGITDELVRKVNISINTIGYDESIPEEYQLNPIHSYQYQDETFLYVQKSGQYFNESYYTSYKTYVYNFSKDKMEYAYKGMVDRINPVNDQLIISDANGSFIIADIQYHIEIANLAKNQSINNQYHLKFNNDYNQTVNIYVDDLLVGTTEDNSFKLMLLKGDHTIKISVIDQNGIETLDTVEINVPQKYLLSLVVEVVTGIVLLAVLILPRKKRRFKRQNVVVEGSELDE